MSRLAKSFFCVGVLAFTLAFGLVACQTARDAWEAVAQSDKVQSAAAQVLQEAAQQHQVPIVAVSSLAMNVLLAVWNSLQARQIKTLKTAVNGGILETGPT